MTARPAPPRVLVAVGAGGVGKTTTAAALAVALARRGASTLIVTIDPARRLASAMGAAIGDELTTVAWPGTDGRLAALMPDPRRSLGTFVDTIFRAEPAAKAHLLRNPIYVGLADAAAGVHELVAMTLVANAAASASFDVIVVDTAPSRHAVDFVTYPRRLASLLGGRTVGWLAGIAERADASASQGGGAGRIEKLLASVTGPNLVRDTASLFGDPSRAREPFVALAERSADLLLGPRTSYLIVAAPTAAACDDAVYLRDRLRKLGQTPRALILNRADVGAADYIQTLRAHRGGAGALLDVLATLEDERLARTSAADRAAALLARVAPIVRCPFIEASAPEVVVAALADQLDRHLATLVPSG